MKILNQTYLTSAFVLLITSAAHGGTLDSGGGSAVVCRSSDGAIQSAETLDLYEARIMYGREMSRRSQSVAEIVDVSLSALQDEARFGLKSNAIWLLQNLRLLPPGTRPKATDDVIESVVPGHCKIETLANFVNWDSVLIDSEIWSKLDNLNRAALVAHEVLYQHDRVTRGAQDSRRTRFLVGQIFSEGVLSQPIMDEIPARTAVCESSGVGGIDETGTPVNRFIATVVNGQIRLQFARLGGKHLFSKTYIDTQIPAPSVPGNSWWYGQNVYQRVTSLLEFPDFIRLHEGEQECKEIPGSRGGAKCKYSLLLTTHSSIDARTTATKIKCTDLWPSH